jgi:hypothetical protein
MEPKYWEIIEVRIFVTFCPSDPDSQRHCCVRARNARLELVFQDLVPIFSGK